MDHVDADIDRWRSQSRKGFLELCVLAYLKKEASSYGLDLMEKLAEGGLEVSEGTLYPLLMRLTKDGLLAAEWSTPESGHPRKYYSLTDDGTRAFTEMHNEYHRNHKAYVRLSGKEE
jgi:PadR family transcriptional regulator PadR